MKSDHQFNVFFVKTIQKHEVLYNFSLKDYSNKEEQEKAWAVVSNEVNESVAACKDRWKNLRASLCRHLRNQSQSSGSSSDASSKKPYYLFDDMKFVLPFTKNRTQPKDFYGSIPSPKEEVDGDPDTPKQVNQTENRWIDQTTPPGNLQVIDDQASSPSRSVTPPAGGVKQERFTDQSDGGDCCYHHFLPSKKPRHEETEDADMSFLKSLIPDMKKMDDRQKNHFKRLILEAVDGILYDQS